jgi:hypothetical protein
MVVIRTGYKPDEIIEFQYRDIFIDKPQRRKIRGQPSKRKEKPRDSKNIDLPYASYINSAGWKQRRQRYFSSHEKRCQICRSKTNIQLHHVIYGKQGLEDDKQLAAVCDLHHRDFHEKFGSKRDMLDEWTQYVEECRA